MSNKRVIITHGFQSNPQRNWFPWLTDQLSTENVEVLIPEMPNPEKPDRNVWIAKLTEIAGTVDENTFFVAHSLGCITDLYYLSSLNTKIGGLILVAGFAEQLTSIPELTDYTSGTVDFENIIQNVPYRVVFGSLEDYIVPFETTKRMAENLDAELVEVADAGHFMQEDGFTHFPALLLSLQNMLAK